GRHGRIVATRDGDDASSAPPLGCPDRPCRGESRLRAGAGPVRERGRPGGHADRPGCVARARPIGPPRPDGAWLAAPPGGPPTVLVPPWPPVRPRFPGPWTHRDGVRTPPARRAHGPLRMALRGCRSCRDWTRGRRGLRGRHAFGGGARRLPAPPRLP